MMHLFARRTLRTWAVLDAVYGVAVMALAIWAVPWKTPVANVVFLLYGAAVLAGAPGLWLIRRWGWRLGVGTSLFGLGAALLVVTGLVASWAYLRAVYGAFGAGASLASLLIAGMVFQVLGLYPAVRLRALLRREVRESIAGADPGAAGSRGPAIAALGLALLPILTGATVDARYRLDPVPPVPDPVPAQSLGLLRALAEGRPPPPAPALDRVDLGAGPLQVTLWQDGQIAARVAGGGRTLAEATLAAGRALRVTLGAAGRSATGRLRVDRIVATGPIARSPRVAFAFALDPGLDGLATRGGRVIFLPDDVLQAAVAGSAAPLAQLDELRAGIDVAWMEARIAEAGVTGALMRIRTEGWIESEAGPLRLHRGNPFPPAPRSARDAAVAAGDYILRQLESDGRFRYRYQPYADPGAPDPRAGEYNLPRHAGTTYGLSLLYAATHQPRFREGAEASLHWLARQIGPFCSPTGLRPPTAADARACILENGQAPVGHAALTAIALLTYQSATGDRRYAELGTQLLRFLLSMQRPDGELAHLYDPTAGRIVEEPPRMFVSEQAALAFALADRELHDPLYRLAAERLLDYLTGPKHDYFLGHFGFGADHWTCLAAEAAWPALPHRRYLDFCRAYASFMDRLQYAEDPAASARDFAGHYGFGQILVPQAPATAGFAEALVSTLALADHHHAATPALRAQTGAALRALARDQLRADNAYLARDPARAVGGVRRSLVEPEIRIDFVQHTASALARAATVGLDQL